MQPPIFDQEQLDSAEFGRLCSLTESYTRDCLVYGAQVLGVRLPQTEIVFDIRGKAAGQCRQLKQLWKSQWCLRFNPKLLLENPTPFVREVVPHEVCHLLAYVNFGYKIRPHGAEWQSLMRDLFNLEPKTTHDFEVERSARQRFPYLCDCEGRVHQIGSIRHQRVKRNEAQYICRTCKAPLTSASEREGSKLNCS